MLSMGTYEAWYDIVNLLLERMDSRVLPRHEAPAEPLDGAGETPLGNIVCTEPEPHVALADQS